METIKLNELFGLLHIPCEDERILRGISDNHRDIEADWLFISRKGYQEHGAVYIDDVLAKGAVVLSDAYFEQPQVYHCDHVEHLIQVIIELYYGDPCANCIVLGVTGTNGKTSVTSIITQLLEAQGNKVMQIGTGFVKYQGIQELIHNTTPGCFQLALYFRKAKTLGITHIVMEVSSHAIDQNRINFLHFDMIIYTNITQDHLDYHLTKTHYRYTKFKLRRYLKTEGVILYNADLPYMQELVNLAQHSCISIGCQEAHFPIRKMLLSAKGSSFEVQGYPFETRLLSEVNMYNIAEAIAVCRRLNIPYEQLQVSVAQLLPIPGRLEVIPCDTFTIWIDYAHTHEALRTLLEFANKVRVGRIISIVGCGGNRDRKKRPLMAKIAAENSDIAVFTSDNPRNERVCDILMDMLLEPYENVQVFENRYYAIKHCIKNAQNSDIIIITGKGNEETTTIYGHEYTFSDRACVQERLLKERKEWR